MVGWYIVKDIVLGWLNMLDRMPNTRLYTSVANENNLEKLN